MYTVFMPNQNKAIESGLNAVEVMNAVLTYDERTYRICRTDAGAAGGKFGIYTLWVSAYPVTKSDKDPRMINTKIRATCRSMAWAQNSIANQLIESAHNMPEHSRYPSIVRDEEYGAIVAASAAKDLKYYAVIGRIPGDDEDSTYVFHAKSADEARSSFEFQMYSDTAWDKKHKYQILREYGCSIFISIVLVSDTDINAV